MKRAAIYGLIAVLAAALIGAGVWGAAWLAGTTDGARWLMDAVSRHTPLTISARTIEGRLFDRLQLRDVRVVLAPVEVGIEHLDFRWSPFGLLSGRVAAKELTLTGVHIRDNTPKETPPDLAWPRVSGFAAFFDGGIERLQVSGLTYRRLDGPPVIVTAISTSVSWRSALLSLADLVVAAPSGRVTGSIAAGLSTPSLRFDLAVTAAVPVAGMDAFSLQARLLPGRNPEQLAGDFTVAGASGKVKRLELAGEAGMTRKAFNLRRLHLTRPDRRGTVTGGGTVTLTAREPLVELQIKAAGIDLTPEIKVSTDLSGTLTLTGTPERYRGEFAIVNTGKGWRTARLSGAYQGDGAGVKLAPLAGSLLGGSVQGSLDVGWREEFSLEGTMRGRNLNPAGISPDWAGVVNFDLTGSCAWSGQAPPRGEVSGSLLGSSLHGQALTGELQADFANGGLRIDRLALQGKGFSINAAGDLSRRLAFDAEVGDLGRLIPRTAGELRADGWVRWHDGRLDGSLTGQGRNLAAAGMRVAAANLTARLGEGKGYPLHVAATLSKAVYEEFQAESVTLEADGTALRHTVNAVLRSAGAEARIALSGAYSSGSWQGEIVRFSGRDRVGPWSLTAPASLTVAAGRMTLAPLVVTGAAPERIEIAGELNWEPLSGSIRAVWNGLNLARVNPWLTEVRVTGASRGNIQLRLAAGERPAFSGSIGASGTVMAEKYGVAIQQGSLSLNGGNQGMRAGVEFRQAGGGVLKGVLSSPAPARLAIPETVEVTAEWADIDLALLRRWLPGDVSLAGRLTGRIAGKILSGDRFDLTGKASLAGGKIRWQQGNEALDATLQTVELDWGWQGAHPASFTEIAAGRLVVAGRARASGILTLDGRPIGVEQGSLSLEGNERGMHADVEVSLAGGGSLKARFSSAKPAGLSIPGEGEVNLEWAGIDLLLIRPWMPRTVTLEGRLAGRATGNLLPEQRFAMKGDAVLSGGKVGWLRPEGEMNVSLRSASVSWEWRGEALRGNADLALVDRGQVRGSFQLPLPARLPTALDRKGSLQASLAGQVREKGLLTALFPGFIQESRGELTADLRVNGMWEEPKIEGSLKLDGAAAYLPTAGIHVKEIQFAMRLEKDLIRIDSFRAASGPGHIEGTAFVRLKGWQVLDYQGSINGERFQTVYLPELQILSTPQLTFEGTTEKLAIRGEVRLPELLISGPPTRAVILPSRDVILEGVPTPAENIFPLVLDVQVRLTIGEKVLVKAEGIDAQLGGSVDLVFRSLDNITSKGEIRVVKGRYRAFGADLEIVRGRLFYAGGPINQPTLDILALRTIDDVRAGITAGGPLRAPLIKLYSEPAMPDVDILAYILFGHPFGTSNSLEQAGMMAQVASTLLSRGQSVSMQEQIKNRLGLSTLEIQSGEASGRMGYKPIPATPPGIAPVRPAGSVSQTMLTVGKYLTPRLYFSYGRSLFTGGNLFRLRYDIFKQWQIETQTGSESGVDLYYKIDFK
ncbi:MAG: translocation/assembly module TamB domain-containing protein [Syntrophales bacterium]